jgi:signal transduction histidine kinase
MRAAPFDATVGAVSPAPPRPNARRAQGDRNRFVDAALTGVVSVAALGGSLAAGQDDGRPGLPHALTAPYALGVALALSASLPLAFRRRHPLAVLGVIELAVALHLSVLGAGLHAETVGLAAAVFTVAAQLPRGDSLRAAAAAGGLNLLIFAVLAGLGHTDAPGGAFGLTLAVAGAWALGDNLGTRRAYLASLEDRAARAEREQQQRAERAVLDERARIARELHDVVAHHVSAIAVQAGAAEEIAETDPRRARQALRTIQGASRQALAEMRALVGVLRDQPEDTQLAPQPGLAQLDRLVAQTRAAGLEVRVHVEGAPRALPEALDLSAFRVVQEALTNTLRHAHATRAEVLVRYGDDDLELVVSDDGAANGAEPAVAGAGRGLIGMRERVALFHGSLDVGRAATGGFRVRAILPIAGALP